MEVAKSAMRSGGFAMVPAELQAPRYIITEPGVGYRFVTNRS